MNSAWSVGDVLLAAPDARGEPFWEDFVVGVLVTFNKVDNFLAVQYEQDAWKPKRGLAFVHKSSRKVGSWEIGTSGTEYRIELARDLDTTVQQLGAAANTVTSEAAELMEHLPGRARKLLQASVMSTGKRRRTTIDVDTEDALLTTPLLGVQVNRSLQARVSEVKEELVDAQEDYGPVVTQNQVHKEEIDELRNLAVAHGANAATIVAIKLKYQRKLAQSSRHKSQPATSTPPLPATSPPPAATLTPATSTPPAATAASSSPFLTTDPVLKTWAVFRQSPIHHINALATDYGWAPHENAGFFPFLLGRSASPYFAAFRNFGFASAVMTAVKNGELSYGDVRNMLQARGFDQGIAVQLATWLTKVGPGSYLIMRHETTKFVSPTRDGIRRKAKPARGIYVIGRVALSPTPGSTETQHIATRVDEQLQRHANYDGIYGPTEQSQEYEVDWFKLGFLDEL